MKKSEYVSLDIQYQFGQAEHAMRATHRVIVGGDFDEWLEALAQKYADSYMEGYRQVGFANLIRKETDADAYFLTSLNVSALLYLRMKQIGFDRAHADYEFVAYMFAFSLGVLEARKYHRLKITQDKSTTAKASRLRSQQLEERFRGQVLYFLEVRPFLHSKDLAKLVEKLRNDEDFKAMHGQFRDEAQQLRVSSSRANAEANGVLEKARAQARDKETRFRRNGFVVPPVEDPNIPTLENLYRWFCKLKDARWIYEVEPKLVQKGSTSRRSA